MAPPKCSTVENLHATLYQFLRLPSLVKAFVHRADPVLIRFLRVRTVEVTGSQRALGLPRRYCDIPQGYIYIHGPSDFSIWSAGGVGRLLNQHFNSRPWLQTFLHQVFGRGLV